jgi:hypothetical protein
MYLKIDDEQKQLIEEISALSGIQREVIREVFEFQLVRWAEKIAENPDKLVRLKIPFLGELAVKYESDEILDTGEMTTNVTVFHSLDDSFKKLIGDIHDEGDNVVMDLLLKKIKNAVLTSSSKND